MSTRSDPLADRPVEGPDRLHYAQGVLLDAQDFLDEQTYHRARLARALKYLFGSGTVAGLEVTWREVSEEIVVQPGLALDPLGRSIEILRPWCLRLRNWFDTQRLQDLRDAWLDEGGASPVLVADVFVRFTVCERGKTPAFATGPYDALDAVTPSRLRDGHELALVVRPEASRVRGGSLAELPAPGSAQALADLLDTVTGAGSPADRLEDLHNQILGAWRDGTNAWDNGTPARLREHLDPRVLVDEDDPTEVGRDPTSVLLARVRVPVDAPVDGSSPPTDREEEPDIDNMLRRFVYAPGVLTQPVIPETP